MPTLAEKAEWIEEDLIDQLEGNEPFPVFFDPLDRKSGLVDG